MGQVIHTGICGGLLAEHIRTSPSGCTSKGRLLMAGAFLDRPDEPARTMSVLTSYVEADVTRRTAPATPSGGLRSARHRLRCWRHRCPTPHSARPRRRRGFRPVPVQRSIYRGAADAEDPADLLHGEFPLVIQPAGGAHLIRSQLRRPPPRCGRGPEPQPPRRPSDRG
jgi:hypothetical protein